jgi:hypothetical protein
MQYKHEWELEVRRGQKITTIFIVSDEEQHMVQKAVYPALHQMSDDQIAKLDGHRMAVVIGRD